MQPSDNSETDGIQRSLRLHRLKRRLAAGHYQPAPEALADRMISRAFFDLLDRYPEDHDAGCGS